MDAIERIKKNIEDIKIKIKTKQSISLEKTQELKKMNITSIPDAKNRLKQIKKELKHLEKKQKIYEKKAEDFLEIIENGR